MLSRLLSLPSPMTLMPMMVDLQAALLRSDRSSGRVLACSTVFSSDGLMLQELLYQAALER